MIEQTSPASSIARPGRRLGPTLAIYVAREIVLPAVFALLVFSVIALAVQTLAFSDLVVNRGLGMAEVARIALFQTVPAIGRSFPFATLLGALIGLGRLGSDRELLAIQASGVAPARVGGPVLAFAAAMTAVAFAISIAGAPRAARGLDAALGRIVSEHPAATLRAGSVTSFGDYRLEAREVSSSGDHLRGVLLWVPSMGETFFAREASLEPQLGGGSRLTLDEGILLTNAGPPGYLRFERMVYLLQPATTNLHEPSVALLAMRGSELRRVAREDPDAQRRRDAEVEWQRRLALPFATFWFGLLAIPLGLRRAGATRTSATLLGVAATILYYGLVQTGNALLRNPMVPVGAAVWLPNVALVAIASGLGLTVMRRAGMPEGGRDRPRSEAPADTSASRPRRLSLDRYVLASFGEMAVLCFVALLLVFLIGDVIDNLQWFVKYQSTFAEVVRFYIARLPVLASRVVPMALLLAASLTMSLLIVRGELVGIWACGVSTLRTVRSILATCVLLAVSYHGLNNELVPRASARASYLKQTEIKNRAPGAVRSSLWYRVGSQLYVAGSLDPLAGEAHDITIYELDSDWLPRSRTDATLAHHVGHGVWRLEAPTRVEVADGSPRTAEAGPFAELGKEVPADVDSSHLTIGDLRRAIQDVESSGYDATSYRVDFQQKLASPLACLVLPLLGLIVATAGPPFWTPAQSLLVCVLEGVGYLALSGIAASLGYGRFLPPPVAGFAPLALMSGAAGVVALRRGLRS